MENYLKRFKGVLQFNRNLSDFFFKTITVKDLRKNPDSSTVFLETPPAFEIDFSNYSIDSSPYWIHFKTLQPAPLFYRVIPNAQIVSKGIVINTENEVVLENCIFQKEYLNELCSNHFVYFKKWLPTTKHTRVLALTNRLDNNYYHWTMETLSRVLLIHEYPALKEYKLLIKRGGSPFMKDSLQFLFDYKEEQIISKSLVSKIKTQSTLVISFPHIRDENTQWTNVYYPTIIRKLNHWAHQKLREKKIPLGNTSKNILISRKNAVERRIINEDEFVEQLATYGFQKVCLEELTYKEQVVLFYQAEKIISVHGAGLANLIYGNNLQVVELFPKERYLRDAFYFTQISAALQFKHRVIEYESVNSRQDLIITESLSKEILKKLDFPII